MSTEMLDKPRRGLRTWWWAVVAVAAVVLAGAVVALVVTRSGGHPTAPAAAASNPASPAAPTAAPTEAQPPPPATPGATAAPNVPAFRFLPLWPFDSVADAVAWQQNNGGHQPWHLDPGETSLAFTRGYLQFSTVDRVLDTRIRGDEAFVTVGWRLPNGQDTPSAVLHLARIGTGDNRPWEVVGSEDTTLSLTTPAYGSRIASPVTVGGRITGVDESLRVQVRGTGSETPLGEVGGLPAGGDNRPWSATVSFRASSGTVRTLVVSTASHVEPGVGRFAIMGVRVA
jgi:hypothetical protein